MMLIIGNAVVKHKMEINQDGNQSRQSSVSVCVSFHLYNENAVKCKQFYKNDCDNANASMASFGNKVLKESIR